jgi:glycosyltransferase involved in cell wall biosynthesis
MANSKYIARRINKAYRRNAAVVYPPVDIDAFPLCRSKEGFYLAASRMVPYKSMDLVMDAFRGMPDKELVVIGDGPDLKKIQAKARRNIRVLGYQPSEVLREYMQRARAFVFAAEEDFGIAPVEAQACGTPVIAYGRGGAMETVINGETGLFFHEHTSASIQKAVHDFEHMAQKFNPDRIRANAERFSVMRFRNDFSACMEREWARFKQSNSRLLHADYEAILNRVIGG